MEPNTPDDEITPPDTEVNNDIRTNYRWQESRGVGGRIGEVLGKYKPEYYQSRLESRSAYAQKLADKLGKYRLTPEQKTKLDGSKNMLDKADGKKENLDRQDIRGLKNSIADFEDVIVLLEELNIDTAWIRLKDNTAEMLAKRHEEEGIHLKDIASVYKEVPARYKIGFSLAALSVSSVAAPVAGAMTASATVGGGVWWTGFAGFFAQKLASSTALVSAAEAAIQWGAKKLKTEEPSDNKRLLLAGGIAYGVMTGVFVRAGVRAGKATAEYVGLGDAFDTVFDWLYDTAGLGPTDAEVAKLGDMHAHNSIESSASNPTLPKIESSGRLGDTLTERAWQAWRDDHKERLNFMRHLADDGISLNDPKVLEITKDWEQTLDDQMEGKLPGNVLNEKISGYQAELAKLAKENYKSMETTENETTTSDALTDATDGAVESSESVTPEEHKEAKKMLDEYLEKRKTPSLPAQNAEKVESAISAQLQKDTEWFENLITTRLELIRPELAKKTLDLLGEKLGGVAMINDIPSESIREFASIISGIPPNNYYVDEFIEGKVSPEEFAQNFNNLRDAIDNYASEPNVKEFILNYADRQNTIERMVREGLDVSNPKVPEISNNWLNIIKDGADGKLTADEVNEKVATYRAQLNELLNFEKPPVEQPQVAVPGTDDIIKPPGYEEWLKEQETVKAGSPVVTTPEPLDNTATPADSAQIAEKVEETTPVINLPSFETPRTIGGNLSPWSIIRADIKTIEDVNPTMKLRSDYELENITANLYAQVEKDVTKYIEKPGEDAPRYLKNWYETIAKDPSKFDSRKIPDGIKFNFKELYTPENVSKWFARAEINEANGLGISGTSVASEASADNVVEETSPAPAPIAEANNTAPGRAPTQTAETVISPEQVVAGRVSVDIDKIFGKEGLLGRHTPGVETTEWQTTSAKTIGELVKEATDKTPGYNPKFIRYLNELRKETGVGLKSSEKAGEYVARALKSKFSQ